MTAQFSIRFPDAVMAQIRTFARSAEVPQAVAVRMLVIRGLGGNVAHALAAERVTMANGVIRRRFAELFEGLKSELHTALDEAIGGTAKPAPEPEEVEEPETEPEVAPVSGRARRPAKARKR